VIRPQVQEFSFSTLTILSQVSKILVLGSYESSGTQATAGGKGYPIGRFGTRTQRIW